jgi:circadian clock protein KaiC
MTSISASIATGTSLPKAPTGVSGFDEITLGGLPAQRPTLVCGGPGCGKTLFAMTVLVNGATMFDEPGVFMSFEEASEDLALNVQSLGFDLQSLVDAKRIVMDYVRVEKSEIEQSGDYDLDGLFIRLDHAIKSIGAKRVVLDTLEVLFAGLGNTDILRAELRRLFGWLKERGVTAIITAERGEGSLTRYGLEEYISDCVILLDNRVEHQITTRRVRIVKYRGSAHGTNEYPFLIDDQGISVLPITSAGLAHSTNNDGVSTGIAGLDSMLGIGGFYRGSSILISGTAGTGKTSIASSFVDAACRRGEKCLYFAFEESPAQIIRNMRSIGINLQPWVDDDLLRFEAARPSLFGLEMHLARMHREIERFKPDAVVLDPISSLRGEQGEVHSALLRVIDLLKSNGTTAVLTNLVSGQHVTDATEIGMSSLMDTWLSLVHLETNGERNRGLYVLKSRGMSHSNQIREYVLGIRGVQLIDAYVGAGGVLTGSSRLAQEAADAADETRREQETMRRRREIERRRATIERQIADLQSSLEAEEEEVNRLIDQDAAWETTLASNRDAMAARRGAAE